MTAGGGYLELFSLSTSSIFDLVYMWSLRCHANLARKLQLH